MVAWYRLPGVAIADLRRVKVQAALARLRGRPAASAAMCLSVDRASAPVPLRRFMAMFGPPAQAADRAGSR